ncbi:MAG: hypothetical protein WAU86_12680 [Oricola sp.]
MRIGFQNQYSGYESSLVVDVLRSIVGNGLEIVSPDRADLIIVGPFRPQKRSAARKAKDAIRRHFPARTSGALRLFHTGENVRHDDVPADYVLSYDLGVESDRHFRLPLWMESIDWSHEGIANRPNRRVARLLPIAQLLGPRGRGILERPRRAALFTTHMREPRRSLFDALSRVMPTQGFGPGFDPSIAHHNDSGFAKDVVLKDFAVNLCPENTLYPGYYTEKIIEAYGAGCLPVTWTDPNVRVDFNPAALVNALDFAATGYVAGLSEALTPRAMARHAEQPLLLQAPVIEPLIEFLRGVVADAR